MEIPLKDIISEEEKENYISALTSELPMLRVKAGISQDELAGLIGVSRQTYGVIERRERMMSWNIFLALIFVFASAPTTKDIIRNLNIFPQKFIDNLSGGQSVPDTVISEISKGYGDIIGKLDEQALHSIHTLIMIEYARCTNQSGEAVIKSFDGIDFLRSPPKPSVSRAIQNIRGNKVEK